jgi:hypothetical protein
MKPDKSNGPRPEDVLRESSAVEQLIIGKLTHLGVPDAVIDQAQEAFLSLRDAYQDKINSNDKKTAKGIAEVILAFRSAIGHEDGMVFRDALKTSDASGKSFLDHLKDLATHQASPAPDRIKTESRNRHVLKETLSRLTGACTFGDLRPGHGSDEVIARQFFEQRTAEWIRVVTELATSPAPGAPPSATVPMPGVPGAISYQFKSPTAQSNIMADGSSLNLLLRRAIKNAGGDLLGTHTYDPNRDRFTPNTPGLTQTTMSAEMSSAVLGLLLSGLFTTIDSSTLGTPQEVAALRTRIGDCREPVGVIAYLELNSTLTPVLLTKSQGGFTHFYNPDSPEIARSPKDSSPIDKVIPGSSPERILVSEEQRLEKMPESSFLSSLRQICLPGPKLLKSRDEVKADLDQFLQNAETRGWLTSHPCGFNPRDLINLTPGKSSLVPDSELDKFDKDGLSVAHHLDRLLQALAHEPETQAHYLQAFLERVYHPGTSTQDSHGACGAESLARVMNIIDLGEWSRVAADLVIRRGSTLRGRLELRPPDDWFKPDRSKNRHCLDALVQSTLLQAASLPNQYYSNQKDKFVDKYSGKEHPPGFSDQAAQKVADNFFGYSHTFVASPKLSEKGMLDHILKQVNPSKPLYTVLKWAQPGQPHEFHAVVLKEVKGGRVYFSNPQGPSGQANGTTVTVNGPEHRIEDDATGYQSMTLAEFKKNIREFLVDEATVTAHQVKTSSWWPKSLWSFVSPLSVYGWASFGLLSVGTTFGGRELERNHLQPWSGTPLTDVIHGATDVLSDPSALARIPLPDFGSWFAEAPQEKTPKTPPLVVPAAATVHVPAAVTGTPSRPLDLKIRDNLLEVEVVLRKANVPTPRIDASSKKLLEETVASFYTAVDALPPFHPHKYKLLTALGDVKDKGIIPSVVADFEKIIESCQPNR